MVVLVEEEKKILTPDEFWQEFYGGEELVLSESDYELLHLLRNSVILKIGKKGSGKTMTAVRNAWLLSQVFGMEIVTDFRLNSTFGDFHPVRMRDIVGFLEQLAKVAELDLTAPEEAQFALEMLAKKLGFSLFNSVIMLDEAYKYLDSRSPSAKITKWFTHWISQIRHFKSCLMLMAPHDDMLDKRATRQIDFLGSCYSSRDDPLAYCYLEDLDDGDSYRIRLEKAKWGQLYESENKLSIFPR